MKRWRLLASFFFGVAPLLGAMWAVEEFNAASSTAAVLFGGSYIPCILLCMVFAQDDGRDVNKPRI